MNALLALILTAVAPAAAQMADASRRFDERAAALEAGVRELELLAPALGKAHDLDASGRAETSRHEALVEALAALDAAKRRYGVAARSAAATAIVASARKTALERADYDRTMSLLDRENEMSSRYKELNLRIIAAHQTFLRTLESERGRRRGRAAAGWLGALLAAGAAGAWTRFRAQARRAPAPPSRLPPRKLPPPRGSGRLE